MAVTIPRRCLKCSLYNKETVYDQCGVCHDLGFREALLCDVNRRGCSDGAFRCHAFKPDLKLLGGSSSLKHHCLPVICDRKAYFRNVVQMVHGPDECDGKGMCQSCQVSFSSSPVRAFHVVWLTVDRQPFFSRVETYIPFFHDALLTCGALINGKVILVWLAPDHLHLYVELDMENPVEDVVEDIQFLVQDALIEEYDCFKGREAEALIWNKEFFIEPVWDVVRECNL